MRARVATPLAVLLALASGASSAQADDDDPRVIARTAPGCPTLLETSSGTARRLAAGRTLLEKGRQQLKDGRLDEACKALAESVCDDPTAEVYLELATCREASNRTASAAVELAHAEASARAHDDRARADEARRRKAALDPRLTRLRITVDPRSAGHVTVYVDGAAIADADRGVALPLDPGRHTVRANYAGALHVVELRREGATEELFLTAEQPPPASLVRRAPAQRGEALEPPQPPYWHLIVLGSVGGAGAGACFLGLDYALSRKNTPGWQTFSLYSCTVAGVSTSAFLVGAAIFAHERAARRELLKQALWVVPHGAGLAYGASF